MREQLAVDKHRQGAAQSRAVAHNRVICDPDTACAGRFPEVQPEPHADASQTIARVLHHAPERVGDGAGGVVERGGGDEAPGKRSRHPSSPLQLCTTLNGALCAFAGFDASIGERPFAHVSRTRVHLTAHLLAAQDRYDKETHDKLTRASFEW